MAIHMLATPWRVAELAHSHCARNSTCEPTWLVSGNSTYADVVVMIHTTGNDFGWYPWYKLLEDWRPPFYAVALDLPGDGTVPAVPNACAGDPLKNTDIDLCTHGHNEEMKYLHHAIQELVPAGKRLFLVGHSAGGCIVEDYVQLGLEPRPVGLIYISNPTCKLWCTTFKSKARPKLTAGAYARQQVSCPGAVMKSRAHGRGLLQVKNDIPSGNAFVTRGLAQSALLRLNRNGHDQFNMGNPSVNEIRWDYIGSPNFMSKEVWHEAYVIAHKECVARPQVPHLIIYGTCAWAFLQDAANEGCHQDSFCKGIRYIPLINTTRALPAMRGTNWLYGHWPQIENPRAVRATIEHFVAKKAWKSRHFAKHTFNREID
eukprot:CAMPEP_0119299460 /NCGR_PEP_ID=MMETSP1333-20130426/1539_1 /TAXON_ID=418940 /ORGANISM="Scyphosphaera apsteinii, Strain RCC1455" /LENGTH=372 /DNA_ID=CAMNT_0007300905 /DNA_START=54 /DNA_END=1172 /DNA_ORIENTATION=-